MQCQGMENCRSPISLPPGARFPPKLVSREEQSCKGCVSCECWQILEPTCVQWRSQKRRKLKIPQRCLVRSGTRGISCLRGCCCCSDTRRDHEPPKPPASEVRGAAAQERAPLPLLKSLQPETRCAVEPREGREPVSPLPSCHGTAKHFPRNQKGL